MPRWFRGGAQQAFWNKWFWRVRTKAFSETWQAKSSELKSPSSGEQQPEERRIFTKPLLAAIGPILRPWYGGMWNAWARGGKSTPKNPLKTKEFIWRRSSEQFLWGSWFMSQGSNRRNVLLVFLDLGSGFGPLEGEENAPEDAPSRKILGPLQN